MKTHRWLTLSGAGLITAFAALIFVATTSAAHAASPATPCDVRLNVELTPDVPNPEAEGFLSSLLSNQVGYRLTLHGEGDLSTIVVDLTGPGPDYRCDEAIETLRRDGRVLSVQVDSDDTLSVAVVTAHAPAEELEEPEEQPNFHVSPAGLGSLYWAARNPDQAWRVVFPVQPDDATDAYADFKARCEFITSQLNSSPACP